MPPRIGPPRVLVVGAGLAGLAAACRLAARGIHVLVLERRSRLGGRAERFSRDGWQWDHRPPTLADPASLQAVWSRLGLDPEADLELERIDPLLRCFWEDGRELVVDVDFWRRPELAQALRDARRWWEQLGDRLDGSRGRSSALSGWRDLGLSLGTVGSSLERLDDRHLAQLLAHLATPRGSHPWKTPAVMLHRLVLASLNGHWRPRGGTAALAQRLGEAARELGIELRTRCEVRSARSVGQGQWQVEVCDLARSATQMLDCDGIVCTAAAGLGEPLLFGQGRRDREPDGLSLSLFTVCLGTNRAIEGLAARNLFFGPPEDAHALADSLAEGRGLPDAPVIELAVDSRLEPGLAPEGGESLVLRTEAPLLGPQVAWESRTRSWADQLQRRLEREFGLAGLVGAVRHRLIISPRAYADDYALPLGSVDGLAMHGLRAFQRLPNQARRRRHVAFAGASTRPGPGVTGVIQSGNLAAEALLAQFKLPL